jgi:hypothetical protein
MICLEHPSIHKFLIYYKFSSEIYLCLNNIMKSNQKILDSKDYYYSLEISFTMLSRQNQNPDIANLYLEHTLVSYVSIINNESELFPYFLNKYNTQLSCLFKLYLNNYVKLRKNKKIYIQLIEFIIAILRYYENLSDKKNYDEFILVLINNEIVEENHLNYLLNTFDSNTVRYSFIEELHKRVFLSEGDGMVLEF